MTRNRIWAPALSIATAFTGTAFAATAFAATAFAATAFAATAFAATPAGPPPPMPMPETVKVQAEEQADGFYGRMVRPRTPGQIQEIWDKSKPEEAVYTADLCHDCTYKVRTREWMVTVIELPRGEVIGSVDIGDKSGFSVQARGKRRLAVRPRSHGYDSSLVIYGKSGTLYPFYLRAEGFNSHTIPDLLVRIAGVVTADKSLSALALPSGSLSPDEGTPGTLLAGDNAGRASGRDIIVDGLTGSVPGTPDDDFVAAAPFDPDALRGWGDYRLKGDRRLRPETVFRDDYFTYIRFGKRWKDIELPAAYVVVDGIDELVNTRVQGQTYIVESTRPLITLKSGESFLCIEYKGEGA